MKLFIQFTSILMLLLLAGFNNPTNKGYKVKKIIIDAGHGGKDSGAVGKFSKEKDIALQLALELGNLIKKNMGDVKVLYTRQKDEFIPIHQRAHTANKNKADVFISIHCNAAEKNKSAHGIEVFTMGLEKSSKNLAVTKRENSVILIEHNHKKHYQGFDPKSPESHILFSLYQNAHTENSLKLAQHIESGFKQHTERKSRGVKQDGLLVLWQTSSPSVLVEVGFITNPEEEKYLNNKIGQHQIATAIFEGFKKYKHYIEHHNQHS
ncbi:MAG: N-acetylmuramoyl-L-alanine amidase [Candidatus Amoebophilus sp. 36-38]|nr:MAG: N-acetylmuramoyl-L-alanine amidase [Candidatus Amoebophilus sp. 36-38]